MKLKIEQSLSSPCELNVFTINEKDAEKDDFGTEDLTSDGEYGCAFCKFTPDRHPKDGVLERYSITLEEFITIGDILAEKLSFYNCGMCK
ncbi:MAG: hypothetical protein PUF49_11385 [Firmicutes bacterium]|nr:hypothetical protein [Bacillota bacterium]